MADAPSTLSLGQSIGLSAGVATLVVLVYGVAMDAKRQLQSTAP